MLRVSSRQVRLASMALLLCAAALGIPAPAAAQTPDTPVIDDANPTTALGTEQERAADPLRTGAIVMELLERAEAALEAGDGPRAARYFEAVVSALPQQALGHRKLCEARSLSGSDFDGAVQACRTALGREGATVQDHLRHLALILARPVQPSPEDIEAVDGSLAHIEKQGQTTPDVLDLSCQLALRLDNTERLSACVKRLEVIAPKDSRTAAYAWTQAMRAKDEKRARLAFARAEELHHDPAKLAEMQASMEQAFPRRTMWYVTAGLIALAGVGLLVALRLRRVQGPTKPSTGAPAPT